MDDITELEKMVREEPDPLPDNSPLEHSKYAFTGGILLIDIATSYTVWMLTGYWYYGAIWFSAGALAFFLHLRNWERAGNNDKQDLNAKWGMGVSVGGMLLVGIASAVLWVTKFYTKLTEGVIVGVLIALFFYHVYQFAMYYFSDDKNRTDRQIARAKALALKRVEFIKAGDAIVSANEQAIEHKKKVYQKHGNRGAVDAAIGLASGKSLPAMAFDTKLEKLDNPNSQRGGR